MLRNGGPREGSVRGSERWNRTGRDKLLNGRIVEIG